MDTTLQNVTIVFPHLFNKSKNSDNYDSAFIFDEGTDTHKNLEAAIDEAGQKEWGDDWTAVKKSMKASNKYAIHSGDVKADKYPEFEGRLYVNTKTKIAPKVVGRNAEPLSSENSPITDGSTVNAKVYVSAFSKKYGKFVSATLLGVQFVDKGITIERGPDLGFKPLTNGSNADDL